MHPIQMQEGNRGIGMGYGQFVDSFASVCRKHQREGRARAFAFVFYDMTHGVVREALHRADGFSRLHDKTGKDVTLFYLHDKALNAHWRSFNLKFMRALGVAGQVNPPCMVFFRVVGDNIEDVSFYVIDEKTEDPTLTVAELESYIDSAVAALNAEGDLTALGLAGKAVMQLGGIVKLAGFLTKLRDALAAGS